MQSHNGVQLDRTMLLDLLGDLQQRTLQAFGYQIRLFVHGGAVMLLHPVLSTSSVRRTTRDVDYIRRAFGHEWRKKGVYDAEERLQSCINATAYRFRIGTDWMNAEPDVALPFARDPQGHTYDPIYYDAKQRNNIEMNTIYTSPGLVLISVTMFWGVALKLVRYRKGDPTDIVAMLRHGTKLNGVKWTPEIMESWIKTLCWPMGYDRYQPHRIEELRDRIRDAVKLLQNQGSSEQNHVPARTRRHSVHVHDRHRTHSPPPFPPPPPPPLPHSRTHPHSHTHAHGQSLPHSHSQSHSRSPPRMPPHPMSASSVIPYHTVSQGKSPLSSPSKSAPFSGSVHDPQWLRPTMHNTRAF